MELKLERQELSPDWIVPVNPSAGNTGAAGTPPLGSTRVIYDLARVFRIDLNPLKADYGGVYNYRKLAPQPTDTDFQYSREWWIDKSEENRPQALEFEVQQNVDGIVFNWAIQFRYSDLSIRTFDYRVSRLNLPGDAWVDTGVKFGAGVFSGGQWHQALLVAKRTPDLVGSHAQLLVDGKDMGISVSRPGFNAATSPGDILNFAEQLDINPLRGGYEVAFRNISFSAK
jgi:hypothetical protein